MTTPDPAGAAGAAVDAVQEAAKPIAFIAGLAAAALGVAWLVRRFGESLPLPAYLVDFVSGDDEDDEDQGADDE